MKFKKIFIAAPLCLGLLFSCSEDNDDMDNPGNPDGDTFQTEVFITDAPIDNAEVKAVFVTVTGVKINGKEIEGFEKTTVELTSLQNGNTKLLGDLPLESGTASNITLMLDNETDASGETPGSYVLTVDGEKDALATATTELVLTNEVEIEASEENEIVLDFDLRKAIVSDGEDYSFVSNTGLASSLRAVNSLHTGIITGNVTEMNLETEEKILVFAYEKGTFAASESEAQAESGLRFTNAVSSAVVNKENGNFSLHYMENGEYELHFASYTDSNADGTLEFSTMLEAASTTDLSLSSLSLEAGAELALEVIIVGALEL